MCALWFFLALYAVIVFAMILNLNELIGRPRTASQFHDLMRMHETLEEIYRPVVEDQGGRDEP